MFFFAIFSVDNNYCVFVICYQKIYNITYPHVVKKRYVLTAY